MSLSNVFPGGQTRPAGDLGLLVNGRSPGLLWKIRNFRHWLRDLWKIRLCEALRIATFYGTLKLQVAHADGTTTDYGVVSHRVITTAYVTNLATYQYDGSGVLLTAFDYHAIGTGTTAESAADTQLQTEVESRVSGTPTNPSAGVYRSTASFSITGTRAITEHGLLSAASTGTLCDRSVFSAVNVVNGDTVTTQYSLTYSAGG